HPGRRRLHAPAPRHVSRAIPADRVHASCFPPPPPELLKQFRRRQDLDPKAFGCPLEVSSIMRHNCLGLPIDRRFEDHFVARIAQLRPPDEPDLDRRDRERSPATSTDVSITIRIRATALPFYGNSVRSLFVRHWDIIREWTFSL